MAGADRAAAALVACPHLFVRVRRWPIRLRWRCAACGLVTRLYDSVDGAAGRPIHPRMSVAVKGYNAWSRRQPSTQGESDR
jgi:hypothetical protein